MPEISLPYGNSQMKFMVPDENFLEILWPNEVEYPCDETTEILHALNKPIGTKPLKKLVKPTYRVAIICDDITRPTPTDRILPIVLDQLNAAGIDDKNIFIVMALGSHRYMTNAEMEKKVGPAIMKRVAVFNSEFRDKQRMKDLGLAPGGVRIWADRRTMEADYRIGVGSIVPHPAVGWSGGGKIIYPGVTGEDTVAQFHLQQGRTSWNMFGADNCPVRLNMERWVDTVGLHFIINVVCSADGRIYRCVAGHYIDAHRVGVRFAKELYGVKAKSRVDIAVVSSHPADTDLWQAGKGIVSGDFLVKDGGTLILVTPCPEGVGPHPGFTRYAGDDRIDEAIAAEIIQGDALAMGAAATTMRIRKRIRIAIVSEGLTKDDVAEAGFMWFATIQEALRDALAHHGSTAKVSIIPFGAEILPIIDDSRQ